MSYNGSGTFQINSSGQPVVTGTVISSTVFNALTSDLGTGLSTAICKDGQTATTARIPFASGISSTLATDATSTSTGSIITAGGISAIKALWIGGLANITGALTLQSTTDASSTSTGSIITAGGIGAAKALWVGGLANITGVVTLQATTDSTSVSTGSLIMAGGLGMAKALWVGGLLNIAGNATFQGSITSTGTAAANTISAPLNINLTATNTGIVMTDAGAAPVYDGLRSGGTIVSPSNVADADVLTSFRAKGYSGATGFWTTAEIRAVVDGAVTDNQRPPSRLEFYTNATNTNQTLAMKITNGGDVQVSVGALDVRTGGSTTISTGVGSVKMSTGNAATNTSWIPIKYAGTVYYVPGYTSNAP